jgi:hypothetical protein
MFITARGSAIRFPEPSEEPAMLTYDDLVELARLCARNSRIATSRDVADELWRMAREYQAQAANLGSAPELGDEPPVRNSAQ